MAMVEVMVRVHAVERPRVNEEKHLAREWAWSEASTKWRVRESATFGSKAGREKVVCEVVGGFGIVPLGRVMRWQVDQTSKVLPWKLWKRHNHDKWSGQGCKVWLTSGTSSLSRNGQAQDESNNGCNVLPEGHDGF